MKLVIRYKKPQNCFSQYFKKAVLSQGNRAMQHVFPIRPLTLNVICFSLRKVKAVIAISTVIAPAVICRLKAD